MKRVTARRATLWLTATMLGLATITPAATAATTIPAASTSTATTTAATTTSAPTAVRPVAPSAAKPASAATTLAARTLNITGQAQEKTNWCWAATGNTIAAYYGYRYSQNQFCNLAFGYSMNATCPNDQATLGNDQRAFRAIGISPGNYISNTLSFSTVAAEIDANRPVMTRILWRSGGGHMMDIYGYDSGNSTIQYYNPWRADPRYNTSTYNWYRSNSQFTWTHSLYRIGA
ncbi:papain-like cysteine protease family protein [Kribbella deserti]|uniref:Papain-like cysteine protease family protein n=1 Tax=Kribbella deserti TaxID=1926257 RepID=A0ABV6QW74_9ACTN